MPDFETIKSRYEGQTADQPAASFAEQPEEETGEPEPEAEARPVPCGEEPPAEPAVEAGEETEADAAEETPVEQSPVSETQQILSALLEQRALLTGMERRMDSLEARVGALGDHQNADLQPVAEALDSLRQAAARQEKANVDMLRCSQNYQADAHEAMRRELEGYRKMLRETAQAPLLTEIANLYVNTQRVAQSVEQEKEKRMVENQVLSQLAEILEDQGVQIITTRAGEPRVSSRCKTRAAVPVGDPALDGCAARSYSPAFVLGRLVLVKEILDTYVYDASLAAGQERETAPDQPEA